MSDLARVRSSSLIGVRCDGSLRPVLLGRGEIVSVSNVAHRSATGQVVRKVRRSVGGQWSAGSDILVESALLEAYEEPAPSPLSDEWARFRSTHRAVPPGPGVRFYDDPVDRSDWGEEQFRREFECEFMQQEARDDRRR